MYPIRSIDVLKENGFMIKKARSRWYLAKTVTETDYTDDLGLLANTPAQAESLLNSLEQTMEGISLNVNANKTEYMNANKTEYMNAHKTEYML